MGTEKPDDNKGKGKSPILESNDPIGTTAESNDKEKPPASSTPQGTSNLQSNDPIGTTAESNDKEKLPASSTPPGTSNLQSDAYAGPSSASGSETSMFLAHSSINDKEKPPASSTPPGTSNLQSDAYVQPANDDAAMSGSSLPSSATISRDNQGNQARQTPIIAAALKVRFPPVKLSQVYIGDTLFVAQYELVRVSSQQPQSIGNMTSIQGPSHVQSGNIRPGAAADNMMGPSHGSVPVQTGNVLPGAAAADNIMGQGSIPQASNILGIRERESSPPAGSMPCQGNRYTESSSSYDTDSQTPSSTEESSQEALKNICMLCKRDVYEEPISSISALPCGHVFHDECLKKFTPKDQAKNPPCIVCDKSVEP